MSKQIWNEIWDNALEFICHKISKPSFEAWIKNARLVSIQDGIAVIEAPNEFTRDWLEVRYKNLITEALGSVTNEDCIAQFRVSREGMNYSIESHVMLLGNGEHVVFSTDMPREMVDELLPFPNAYQLQKYLHINGYLFRIHGVVKPPLFTNKEIVKKLEQIQVHLLASLQTEDLDWTKLASDMLFQLLDEWQGKDNE